MVSTSRKPRLTPQQKYDRKVRQEVDEIIKGIAAIEVPQGASNTWGGFDTLAQQVLKVLEGKSFEAWRTYDDQCWARPNFWIARSVRNSRNYDLWKVLKG